MTSATEIHGKLMRNPEFKKIWDESTSEREFTTDLYKMRMKAGISSSEFAKRAGISEDLVSGFESPFREEDIGYTPEQIQKIYEDVCAAATPATP